TFVSCPISRNRLVFFFFQAEDGIRDGHVTGVQTCALPISDASCRARSGLTQTELAGERFSKEYVSQIERGKTRPTGDTIAWLARSEERRVGKECGGGWEAEQCRRGHWMHRWRKERQALIQV